MRGLYEQWSEDKQKLFRDMAPHFSNTELAKIFGVSKTAIYRTKHLLGIKPTPETMERYRKMQSRNLRAYAEKGDFTERTLKSVNTCNRIRSQEKRRLKFGLEQKTNYFLRIAPSNKKVASLRCNLRTRRGYICLRSEQKTIFYDENTNRSQREQRYSEQYHVRFAHISEAGASAKKVIAKHDYLISGE